jgi:hypothetical protein
MNRSFSLLVWLLLANCCFSNQSLSARPWTDSTGKRTIEAEFVSLADGKVTLKKPDGKTVSMALDKLSAADQKLAKELAAKGEPAAGETSAAKVELISLAVAKGLGERSRTLQFFGAVHEEGSTSLVFLVNAGEQHFVGFNGAASKIVSFKDDRGTDLNAKPLPGADFGLMKPFDAMIASDGKVCVATVNASGTPAAGSIKIAFDGELAIRCGKDETSAEQKDVALEAGSKIDVGPTPLVVEAVQDQDFGDVKFMVTLNSSKPRDAIKAIEFLDADGTVIESESMGGGSFGFGDEMTYQTNHGLKTKVDKVTVRVTFYANVETILVPVKIETGVGF